MATVYMHGKARYAKVFEHNRDMGENLQPGDQKDKIALTQGQYIVDLVVTPEEKAKAIAKNIAPVTSTLGDAVVGGSSQAVGSPTNTARIAHYLAKDKGNIKKVTVELYPELFARRGINMPGIIMGAVFGSPTSDYDMYKSSIDKMNELGIDVEVIMAKEYSLQRITIETEKDTVVVDALNRGGGRLVLRDATPSKEEAEKIAKELGIVLVK